MTKYSSVRAVLSVAHNSPEGKLHGHSYAVWAKFRFGSDARMLKRHVENVTVPLDHDMLKDEVSLAENLAEYIGSQLPGCIFVECRRELEGFSGEWVND
jgi:6-pyruvoyl-tetrahydropterin synthase